MNELDLKKETLPDTLPDLVKFVWVTKEEVTACKAALKAMSKLKVAQEVLDQKTEEARLIQEASMDAKVRIGQLIKAMPKSEPVNQHSANSYNGNQQKPRATAIENAGLSNHEAYDYMTMADNAEIVEQVKDLARQGKGIPTDRQVFNMVAIKKRKEQKHGEQKEADRVMWSSICGSLKNIVFKVREENSAEMVYRQNKDDLTNCLDMINNSIVSLVELRERIMVNAYEKESSR